MKNSIFNNKIILLLVGIIIGWQASKLLKPDLDENSKKLLEAYSATKEYYIDSVSPDTLVDKAIDGMLSGLDPFTVYIPTETQELIDEQFNGAFEGIGIEFQIINDTITVVSPITGGPSEKLGIIPGDKIVEINGTGSIGFSNNEVVEKLRGNKGTTVDVTIYRPSMDELLEFEITRDTIPLHTVDAAVMYNDSVGYISLTRFGNSAKDEIIGAIETLQDSGLTNLVLDLRNNPGGLLDQAVAVSDLFISGNKMIVYTNGRLDRFNEEYRASENYPYEKIPLTILINRGSASASEIVAGAIQDWDRGVIVGETSFGKGLVQSPFILADNSAVRITISKYFTPSGRAIQRDYNEVENYFTSVTPETERDSLQNKKSSQKEYKTKNGRTVHDHGGITPDYKAEGTIYTDYTAELRSYNLFYRYIRHKFDSDKGFIPAEYLRNLRYFANNFKFDEEKLNNFVAFAEINGVEKNMQDFLKDKKYIAALLKAYVAREIWKDRGWYTIILDVDMQFQKALEKQNEALEMVNIN